MPRRQGGRLRRRVSDAYESHEAGSAELALRSLGLGDSCVGHILSLENGARKGYTYEHYCKPNYTGTLLNRL